MTDAKLTRWKCHKEVDAEKILSISISNDGLVLYLENGSIVPVDQTYLTKHAPMAGGYFVVYAGGYQSFSPADVFEAGYSKIS